jgi:hypothetical protein
MNVKPFELDHANMEGFARLKAEWRMKAELLEADEGIGRIRGGTHRNASHLRRRPDSQPAPLRLKTVSERDMKAVQFHTGVKALLKGCHNVGAEERFRAAEDNRNGYGQDHQQHEHTARKPLEPAVPAPERVSILRQRPSPCVSIIASFACRHFLFDGAGRRLYSIDASAH